MKESAAAAPLPAGHTLGGRAFFPYGIGGGTGDVAALGGQLSAAAAAASSGITIFFIHS